MEIVFDYTLNQDGEMVHKHVIETDPGKYPQFSHAAHGPDPVDVIHLIRKWHDGTVPVKGTGWDELTNHPSYPGKTRLEALISEMVRLDDPQRKVLGL